MDNFSSTENKHDVYMVENCKKKFCESLRKHAMKIINSEKNKMITLTNEQHQLFKKSKNCYICKKYVQT